MSGSPFILCSWRENFLSHLVRHALERTGGDLGQALFIFPHSRPMRYMTDLLKRAPDVRRPLLMPQMHSVTELFGRLAAQLDARSRWKAGSLDQVGLLLRVVRELNAKEDARPEESFPAGDARFFYPWGRRLAALFEECLAHGRAPADLPYLEEQVLPFAATLLSDLSSIFQGYTAELEALGWTTPGLDAYRVIRHMREEGNGFLAETFGDRAVILAGFHALTGTEDRLFKTLWAEYDASVLLHADPALTDGKQHWSCDALKAWADSWKTRLVPAGGKGPAQTGPEFRFCEGYDLHSQLEVMQKELEGADCGPGGDTVPDNGSGPDNGLNRDNNQDDGYAAHTAVILPESGLLMPVMHHLPLGEVNISMGYPLSRSPLFRLLDTLLALQENRRANGYHWRDVVSLIRHPYIKMLCPDAEGNPHAGDGPDAKNSRTAPGARTDLRRELHALEQALRQGAAAHTRPLDLLEAVALDSETRPEPFDPANLALVRRVLEVCLAAFENLSTPAELASALEGVARVLLRFGGDLWERFPIDAECLYRLLQSLIPELARSALSREALSAPTLYALARQLMESERVPFEASPLVGMQVLGMLETRLLTFRKVIVLQATEDLLPGAPPADPLLPESLRPALGLPEARVREQVAAYNFFRLLAGAETALLLWQEGGEGKGLEEKKKKKSRFIEELLWDYEQKTGRLLGHKESSGPLTVLSCSIAALPRERRPIPRTAEADRLLERYLERPVSSTALDDYLQCPARFFQGRVLRLDLAEEPDAREDPRTIGNLLHRVLQDFYAARAEQGLPSGEETPEAEKSLEAVFEDHLNAARLKETMPADAFAMLRTAGRERLARYIRNQPPTRVLGLEKTLAAPFPTSGRVFTLTGTVDRLDLRDQGPVIVDYKTGGLLPAIRGNVWQDQPFWKSLQEWEPGAVADSGPDPTLMETGRRFGSIQLPFYILLYRLAYGEDAANALWVQLADSGQEKLLFDKRTDEDTLAIAVSSLIPELVSFLLRHMRQSACFCPQPGLHCGWCSVRASCMVTAVGRIP